MSTASAGVARPRHQDPREEGTCDKRIYNPPSDTHPAWELIQVGFVFHVANSSISLVRIRPRSDAGVVVIPAYLNRSMFTDQICDAVALLREALPELDPKLVFGRDAARMTETCAEGERLLATAKMLFAQRTAECGTWRGGRAVTEEQWLAQVSGTSETAARDSLATAARLQELPATDERLRAGKLSLAQATQVTAGATVDPAAEAKLLRVAEHSASDGSAKRRSG